MKKKITIAVILTLASLAMTTGCQSIEDATYEDGITVTDDFNQAGSYEDNFTAGDKNCNLSKQVNALRERITTVQELQHPVTIERKLLKEDDVFEIYVPWIAEEEYRHINEMIESYIIDYIDDTINFALEWDDEWEFESCDFWSFDYNVTYNRNGILSFHIAEEALYWGRPRYNLRGINIDLHEGRFISTTELFDVDANFLERLFAYREDDYIMGEEIIISYLMETHGEERLLETINNGVTHFYFSQEYIYVRFGLIQALGYYMVLWLPWEQTSMQESC